MPLGTGPYGEKEVNTKFKGSVNEAVFSVLVCRRNQHREEVKRSGMLIGCRTVFKFSAEKSLPLFSHRPGFREPQSSINAFSKPPSYWSKLQTLLIK